MRQGLEIELAKLDIDHCVQLQMQGYFIAMDNIDKKISHQIYSGWELSDSLVKFIVRARMNQLPCKQVIHMWKKDHGKSCALCNYKCKSVAHLMNSIKWCECWTWFAAISSGRVAAKNAMSIERTKIHLDGARYIFDDETLALVLLKVKSY